MKRSEWIDSCRFLAIFVIMVTHFIAAVRPDVLELWITPPSSWLLYGLTGKFSVAFFFVLLGYFASKPVEFNIKRFASYTVRRYLQFAFYIFVCTSVFILGSYAVTWLFHTPEGSVLQVISDGLQYNLIYLLRDSFLFEDNYNATLWCMQQLFVASLVCKVLGFIPERYGVFWRLVFSVLLIAALLLLDAGFFVWVCAAVLGYILRLCLDGFSCFSNKAFVPVALAIALVLIKLRLDEGVLQYSLQSIAAFLLILAQFRLKAMQDILSTPPLPWLGGISMGLFVTHTPVNALLYASVYPILLRSLSETMAQFVYFIVSLSICIFSSWLLAKTYSAVTRLTRKETVKT